MATDDYDFSGVWRSEYTYTSDRRGPGEYTSAHNMMAQRRGNKIVFQSLPESDGSFMLVRLRLDGRIASGGWEETSSATGPFKGTRFYGALMLVLDEDGKAFRGMWLGVGKKMYVKANKWEIVHNPQAPAHLEVI
jgi:hypothetical protein